MNSSIEPAFAKHFGNEAMFFEVNAASFDIALKEPCSGEHSRDNLGV